jgi:hypothetical protein
MGLGSLIPNNLGAYSPFITIKKLKPVEVKTCKIIVYTY